MIDDNSSILLFDVQITSKNILDALSSSADNIRKRLGCMYVYVFLLSSRFMLNKHEWYRTYQ